MRRRTRSLHRALVPVAALPLLLTTVTGLLFSLLEQQGIERPWLLQIHTGHFGRLDLSAAYPPC